MDCSKEGVLLNGFGFSGYRSFGNELVKIAPLKMVNLIIGQNNTGKSNIINFLKQYYSSFIPEALGQTANGEKKSGSPRLAITNE
jgi:AAA15 family ATPase/GTPase